jgi:hypothetical protein
MSQSTAQFRACTSFCASNAERAEDDTQRPDTTLEKGCLVVAFLVPLKLSLSYIALIPLILLWFWRERRSIKLQKFSPSEKLVAIPALFFMTSVALSALIGINPIRSILPFVSLAFFATTIFVFAQHGKLIPVLIALLTGQVISSLHSVLDAAYPDVLLGLFVGTVSESGQLALSIPVILGLLWRMYPEINTSIHKVDHIKLLIGSTITTIALVLFGFRKQMDLPLSLISCIFIISIAFSFKVCRHALKSSTHTRRYAILLCVYAPLLVTALAVNLKRGPWLGVVVGSIIFFWRFAPRMSALVVSIAVVCAATIAPITERLAASYQHFTIAGGRSTIWRIGLEMIAQFPLGIGLHNSAVLQSFAPEIPPELKHFHNNLINITAESGWLGCGMFLWFILAIIQRGFVKPLNPLHVAIGCSILSWQTAGLVEYNFGDSEVVLLAWILVGVLLYDQTKRCDAALGQR